MIYKKVIQHINFVLIPYRKYFLFDVQYKVWKNDFTVWVSKMKIKTLFVVFFKCSQIKMVWSVIFELDEVSVSNFGVIFFYRENGPKTLNNWYGISKVTPPICRARFQNTMRNLFFEDFFLWFKHFKNKFRIQIVAFSFQINFGLWERLNWEYAN